MNRRAKHRIEWNGLVKYRLSHGISYKPGILKNASASGAMLWMKEELAVGSLIDVLMESRDDHDPVNVHMRIVRTEKTSDDDYTGYGCKLEMTVSEAA